MTHNSARFARRGKQESDNLEVDGNSRRSRQGGDAMRFLHFALSAVVLTSCAIQPVNQPQNREEFKAALGKGAAFTKVETYFANRRFEDATKLLKTKTEEGLDYRLAEGTRSAG